MGHIDYNDIHSRLVAHEATCVERWKTIFHRMEELEGKIDRLQFMLLGATGTVVIFLAGIILTLLDK